MATDSDEYHPSMQARALGSFNLETDVVKAALMGVGFVKDLANKFMADVAAAEVNGTGYQSGFAGTGRQTLGNKLVNVLADGANWVADSLTFAALQADVGNITAIVLYKHLTSDGDSPLIAVGEFSPVYVPTGNDLIIQWDATKGILKWTNI